MNRTRIKLNENWHFHEGDIEQIPLTDKNSAYQHAKTRRALDGPAAVHYNSNPDNWDTSKPHLSSAQAPMLQTTSRRRIRAAACEPVSLPSHSAQRKPPVRYASSRKVSICCPHR